MMSLRPAPVWVWLNRSESGTNSIVWMKEEMIVYPYALGYLRLADTLGFLCFMSRERRRSGQCNTNTQ